MAGSLNGEAKASSKWVGKRLRRKEDPLLLTGRAKFIDDLAVTGMHHASVVRSPYAHAAIKMIDASRALGVEGVIGVVTGQDAVKLSKPLMNFFLAKYPQEYALANGKVRYVGEPVAMVVARDNSAAEDAAELIDIEYEPLPAVVDAELAMGEGSPMLHDDVNRNIVFHDHFEYGDVEKAFQMADRVFNEEFLIPRWAGAPLETLGCIASYEPTMNSLTLWANTQIPFTFRTAVAACLGIPKHLVRVVVPQVGGAFGTKIYLRQLAFTALASKKLGVPVKWIEDRREHLTASVHSPERKYRVQYAVKIDGTMLGVRARVVDDLGAYLNPWQPLPILRQIYHLIGPYTIGGISLEVNMVCTNKCPTGAYRGFGVPHAVFILERGMDVIARSLGLDTTQVRMKNLIQPKELPLRTAVGAIYDSGDYPGALQKLLEMIDYPKFRREQQELRLKGRLLGIGFGYCLEPGASAAYPSLITPKARSGLYEGATVRVETSGEVSVMLSTMPAGGGHETAIAQVVADELGIAPEQVEVFMGDTASCPPGTGYYGSRFSIVGVGAILSAVRKVKEKMCLIASHLMETKDTSFEFVQGMVRLKADSRVGMPMREICSVAYNQPHRLPQGMEPALEAISVVETPNVNVADDKRRVNFAATYANSAQAAVVEVDAETGLVKLLKYAAVHDCGVMINPMLVEGQIVGGLAQGIGGALLEEVKYDDDGQPLASTFMDYFIPTFLDVPEFELSHMVSPSPFTLLGTKGVGEGGTLASPAAIANAVEDAVSFLGVKIRELPLTPERIWRLIKGS